MPNLFVPTVVQPSPRGDRAFDIYSRLLEERIVFLGTELDADVANLIIAQFLHLEADAATKDVRLYINSPGGDMNALFAVYDTMRCIRPDVSTVCIGQAASAAAVLLAGGAAGKRYALPNSRVLIHQPWGGVQGQSTDMERAVLDMVHQRERMVEILAHHSGQPIERVTADIDRDFILRGDDAVAYGLVDTILEPADVAGGAPGAADTPIREPGAVGARPR